MQKWTDEGGQDDAAPLGKFFCFRVVDLCGNVIQGFHQWCKNMDMDDILRQIKVVNGKVTSGVILHDQYICYIFPTGSLHTNHCPI